MRKVILTKRLLYDLGAVFFTAVLLRSSSFFVPYYNIDEITNALFGHFILDGRMGLSDFLGNTYIFTHYLYTAILHLTGRTNLLAVHLVHAVWVGLTAVALYWAGRELTFERRGGMAAGILYALFSVAFFAKDFQAALSESFSLLPAALAAFFFLRGLNLKKEVFFFAAGFFMGVSSLFKAPAGIMIVAGVVTLMGGVTPFFRFLFSLAGGFILAHGVPFLFTPSLREALDAAVRNLFHIKVTYIQAYENLPFLYWFSKYLVRTSLIVAAGLLVWVLAFKTIKGFLLDRGRASKKTALAVFFLFVWLLCDWFVVAIGKRVFYHYFIFLIVPVVLLATPAAIRLTRARLFDFRLQRGAYGWIFFISFLSIVTFSMDGILRFTLKDRDFSALISYVRNRTLASDRIYVWGLLPQLYFFSQREPASTMIWADTLAGFSTGSPAMEYMRSTGKTLSLPEGVARDLTPPSSTPQSTHSVINRPTHPLAERELLFIQEILDRIEHAGWKKLFEDFFKEPPVLFLDTSPTGIRSFSKYPVEKYDLLKKFLEINYRYEGMIDHVMIYRLKEI